LGGPFRKCLKPLQQDLLDRESSNIHRLNFELKVCCLHKKNVFRGNQNSRCVCCQKKLLYFLKSFEKFGSNKDWIVLMKKIMFLQEIKNAVSFIWLLLTCVSGKASGFCNLTGTIFCHVSFSAVQFVFLSVLWVILVFLFCVCLLLYKFVSLSFCQRACLYLPVFAS
jgi:hypothetical protein